ncbi:GSCOCG00012581001-RA-CDS [Cotesia congregata]|nr:GSCOCG00012581001-RA-CDS [Cotesia congregata]
MDPRWIHPFTAIISGPNGCGKTFFVKRFLNEIREICDTEFKKVIFYYAEWQQGYAQYDKSFVEFREGLPQSGDFDDNFEKLVVVDDLMRESSNGSVVDLFTKGSHHKNLSVMFLS